MCDEAFRRTQLGEVVQEWGRRASRLSSPRARRTSPARRLPHHRPGGDHPRHARGDRGDGHPLSCARISARLEPPLRRSPHRGRRRPASEWGPLPDPRRRLLQFTDPTAQDPPPKKKPPKSKWAFTMANRAWFCIAGVWRTDPAVGSVAMLACLQGEDITLSHDRQVVVGPPTGRRG
ncbi:hypothetical protein AB5I41_20705 [Sphingomonas sp. MMS24-JH45]